ncbi:hypothetical protein [Conexibacter sp. SYSU D00693]|uniref:hypothetical protein n=1 Tax=Conexibacter sp. SYSU D00693 TaxID=2812560 RepID=UPI00196B2444|nr:hypothetical protein [Conexibacter sp. SYSU D00693]
MPDEALAQLRWQLVRVAWVVGVVTALATVAWLVGLNDDGPLDETVLILACTALVLTVEAAASLVRRARGG